jgi:hypothetical protein
MAVTSISLFMPPPYWATDELAIKRLYNFKQPIDDA